MEAVVDRTDSGTGLADDQFLTRFYTREELAERWRVTRRALRLLELRGELPPAKKLLGLKRYPKTAIAAVEDRWSNGAAT